MYLAVVKRVRTNNFNDDAMMQKISTMWKEATTVLNNKDDIIYGLYSEYESDYKGDYSLSVAIESSEGDTTIKIPEANYERFVVDISDENGIVKVWQEIWEREEKGELKRAYSFDFEKYYPNGQIEIYIAVQ
ncbi:effector binding domain-containing protein [Ornithinibacillus sp. BX22]|uniref:Effector binding domain-containing protein n=1 Tax=Ornithinibacillus hominis TaxID=2763055 RepID=A0A923L7A1_9BACI|nr:effector binding domain-containing protein [Ornithinibacillus hominis]MBC5637815.1 effector binding domain-containing protein [Ornithinibacillus hominis]